MCLGTKRRAALCSQVKTITDTYPYSRRCSSAVQIEPSTTQSRLSVLYYGKRFGRAVSVLLVHWCWWYLVQTRRRLNYLDIKATCARFYGCGFPSECVSELSRSAACEPSSGISAHPPDAAARRLRERRLDAMRTIDESSLSCVD
jgi:hypothetical protein